MKEDAFTDASVTNDTVEIPSASITSPSVHTTGVVVSTVSTIEKRRDDVCEFVSDRISYDEPVYNAYPFSSMFHCIMPGEINTSSVGPNELYTPEHVILF